MIDPSRRNRFTALSLDRRDELRNNPDALARLWPSARLIVVDFAPHAMEFLRETYAHERLGFSKVQMAQWLAEAGLDLADERNLVPAVHGAEGKLTVSVWTAVRPALASAPRDGDARKRVDA